RSLDTPEEPVAAHGHLELSRDGHIHHESIGTAKERAYRCPGVVSLSPRTLADQLRRGPLDTRVEHHEVAAGGDERAVQLQLPEDMLVSVARVERHQHPPATPRQLTDSEAGRGIDAGAPDQVD